MCAESLVGAVGIKVHTQRLHIRNDMGCIRHAVRHHQRTHSMRHLGDRRHVIVGAHEVGAQGAAHNPGFI